MHKSRECGTFYQNQKISRGGAACYIPIFERNMNMKTCIRLLCAVCCAAMLLTTTACSGGDKNTSSATAEATPAPEITPAPEATAAPEEEPTPAPEGNTSSETGENRHTSTLPVPETGSEEFRAAFENQPHRYAVCGRYGNGGLCCGHDYCVQHGFRQLERAD